jgi:hypothetical protein
MKLAKVAAFGIGYVLGSRAGRKRYGQIAAMARTAARRLETYGTGGGFTNTRINGK